MNLATLGVDPEGSGAASAMVNAAQQMDAAFGTALLNTIAVSATAAYLATQLETADSTRLSPSPRTTPMARPIAVDQGIRVQHSQDPRGASMYDVPWDARYQSSSPRLFSGKPNPTLITETTHLRAGRALDIGCGEGADAIWLAEHGWDVTAIDIASTALQRAAHISSPQAERITWLECDITQDSPPAGPFDLVTMHYIPLLTEEADRVLPSLLNTVGPGGTFLFVTHDINDLVARGDFDPHHYCQPDDITKRLGPKWTVTIEEKRRRNGGTQPRTTPSHDAILNARRGA